MYNEGFLKSDLSDFPTRTLIYTCGESKILILRKKQSNLQNYLNSELKGVSGVHSKNPTIRGTVVLGGFEKAKKENEKLFYDSIDPLGMYRAITSGKFIHLIPMIIVTILLYITPDRAYICLKSMN